MAIPKPHMWQSASSHVLRSRRATASAAPAPSAGREGDVGEGDPGTEQERRAVEPLGEMAAAIVEDRSRVRSAGREAEAGAEAAQDAPGQQGREARCQQAGAEVADDDEQEP